MSILNVNTIQPIGSGTTVTVAATELKTSNFITVGTGASVTSPSANVLTLGTNTAERFRITSAGSIGIGTDNPGTKLDVRGGNWSNGDIVVGQSGNAGRIKFRRGADGSDSGSIGFAAADNNSRLAINVASGDGTIAFQTNSVERLRIDSSGRILIGRTSTSHGHSLQVQADSGANAIAIQGRSVDDQSEITFYENDNSTILGQIQHLTTHSTYRHRSGYLRFDSGGVAEKMRLDSSGRLLLGTTTPGHAIADNLTISDSGSCGITLISGTSNYGALYFGDSGGNNRGQVEYSHSADSLHFYTAAAERLRIYNDGSVRIGDNSVALAAVGSGPTLGINGSAPEITLRDSAANNPYAVMRTNDYGSLYLGADQGNNHSSSAIHFHVDNSEKMRITGSGHVLRPTMAAAAVTLSGDQNTLSTFNGSYQTLALNSEGYDNANNFNTSNYRFIAPETGFYNIGCNVQLENGSRSASGNRWMYLYPIINGVAPGTSVGGNQADFDPADTHYYSWNWSSIMKLSQNDYVEWKYTGNLDSINLRGQGQSVFYFYQVG